MTDTTYAEVIDLAARVDIADDDTSSDDVLQDYLNTAAWMADTLTRGYRQGYEAFSESEEETRLFDDYGGQSIAIDDLLTLTSFTRGGTEITSDYYMLHPYNTLPKTELRLRWDSAGYTSDSRLWHGYPGPSVGRGQVAITGTWGYCTEDNRPPVVKELTLQIAETLFMEVGLSTQELMAALRNPVTEAQKRILGLAELLQKDREGGVVFA